MQTEVIVLGAGSAGIAAAVAARRAGANVTLFERHPFPGGMATAAMVGTFCGLYFRDPEQPLVATPGFPIEFAEAVSQQPPQRFAENLWFLPYDPECFKSVARAVLHEHGIDVRFNTEVQSIERTNHGFRVGEHNAHALVDCSGHALASRLLGLPVMETELYQSGAIVFGVDGLPDLPTDLLRLSLIREIQRGIHEQIISADLLRLSIVPGSHRKCSALLKLGLPVPFAGDEETYEALGRKHEAAGLAFLREHAEGFDALRQTHRATQVGIRSAVRPVGDAILSESDVLQCRKPADGIAIGAWPIEYWGGGIKPDMVYFDPHDHYTIPAGCLQTAACPGLYFAGRNISADERALASARVMGTCLATGYAAGEFAAKTNRAYVSP